MKFKSLRRLFDREAFRTPSTSARSHAKRSTRKPAVKLEVETLEDRTLMSVIPAPTVFGQTALPNSVGGRTSSPDIVLDPSNPQRMVAVFQSYNPALGPDRQVVVSGAYSADGGKTWANFTIPGQNISDPAEPTPSNDPDHPFEESTNPTVAFDRSGHFYVAYAEHSQNNAGGAIMFEKFDFSTGVPVQVDFTNVTSPDYVAPANRTIPQNTQDMGIVYEWASIAEDPGHSDPALNPVIAVDNNLLSFTDPTTGATQNDPNLLSPSLSIQGISLFGSTVSVTTASPHGYVTGDTIQISGVDQSQFDGQFKITKTGSNTFNFTVSGSPPAPTGTNITAQKLLPGMVYIAWNTNAAAPATSGNDIMVIASDDGGRTWTSPTKVDTGGGASAPTLAIPQGTVSDRHALKITSLTSANIPGVGTVATATTDVPHGYQSFDTITIAGANQAAYNGPHSITKVDATTFTYVIAGSPASPATGTITALNASTQGAVQGGELNVVWDYDNNPAGVHQIRATVIKDGGAAAVFTDPSPHNQNSSNAIIEGPSGGPAVPTTFSMPVNITDPNFTTLSNLTVTVAATDADIRNLQFRLFPKGSLDHPFDLVFGPTLANNNDLFVSSRNNSSVAEYNGTTGALVSVIVSPGTGGLSGATSLAFGPDNNLYIASAFNNEVLEYNMTTQLVTTFVVGNPLFNGGLQDPEGIAFNPDDGNLYVTSHNTNQVLEYQGPASGSPGAFIKAFVVAGSGGLSGPEGLAFGPDHELYVSSFSTNTVMRYQGVLGASPGANDPSMNQNPAQTAVYATNNLLQGPTSLAFGPDGDLYVSSSTVNQILRFSGPNKDATGTVVIPYITPGQFLDQYVPATGGLNSPQGLAFGPGASSVNNNLYVVSEGSNSIDRYQFVPGVSMGTFVAHTAAAGPNQPMPMLFQGANVLVGSFTSNSIQRFDATGNPNPPAGNPNADFVTANSGGLNGPTGLATDVSGNLYVSSFNNSSVLQYNGATGAFNNPFVTSGQGGLSGAADLKFGPNNDLYVSSLNTNQIMRYNGKTGANKNAAGLATDAIFATLPFGYTGPRGIAFDSVGNLYVAATGTTKPAILVFNGTTGAFKGVFADATNSPISDPQYLFIDTATDPNVPSLYVSSKGNNQVLRFNLNTGQFLESIVPVNNDPLNNGGLTRPEGLAINAADGRLYVNSTSGSGINDSILVYSPVVGKPLPSAGNVGATFIAPGGGGNPILLLGQHAGSGSFSPSNAQANGLGFANGLTVGTTFDDRGPRSILSVDPGGNAWPAPHAATFIPEGQGSLSGLNGFTASQLNGTWTLEVTDTVPNADAAGSLLAWSLNFTSRVTPDKNGDRVAAKNAIQGSPSSDGSSLSNSNGSFADQTLASPDRGVGPTPRMAIDNTLGSFSPYQGRIYVAYTGGSGNNTDIYLVTSDDGGQNWSLPAKVNDDSASDNFSQGIRAQFDPSIAVDQSTGTLLVSFYDARNDAANARPAMYLATSVTGGHKDDPNPLAPPGSQVGDFAPETYLNPSQTAIDAITNAFTGQPVVLEPIPDNASANNAGAAGFGVGLDFGDHQGLAVDNGHVYAAWAGNQNLGGMNIYVSVQSNAADQKAHPVTIADGPRVVSSTEGAATFTHVDPTTLQTVPGLLANKDDGTSIVYDNLFSATGVQEANGFVVTFDRPVDVSTFTAADVKVYYHDTLTPASATNPGTLLPVTAITPLDGYTTLFGPAKIGQLDGAGVPVMATQFLVNFAAQSAVGTYSYSVGPSISDRIRTETPSVTGTPLLTTGSNTTVMRVPPKDTGGDGIAANDTAKSTITLSGVPAGQIITGVTVSLDIQHTFDSDLVITLTSPSGTVVTLANQRGGAGQDFSGTTFDDTAGFPISSGLAPFPGSFTPETPLAALNGQTANGTWTLSITDTRQNNTGNLLDWSINVTSGTLGLAANPGNNMDQNADGVRGEAPGVTTPSGSISGTGDVYSVPLPTENGPFQLPYASTSLPLIVTGPHVVDSFVPGQSTTEASTIPGSTEANTENLILNTSNNAVDVVFDRDMDPNSINAASIVRIVGPAGLIYQGPPPVSPGATTPVVQMVPDPNPNFARLINGVAQTGADPDPTHPRTYRILISPNLTAQKLSGVYNIVLASTIRSEPGPALAVASMSRTGSVVTVTTTAPHGLVPNQQVIISGVTPAQYDGTFTIAVQSPTQFTYTLTGTPPAAQPTAAAGTTIGVQKAGDLLDTNQNAGLDVLRGQNNGVAIQTNTTAPSTSSEAQPLLQVASITRSGTTATVTTTVAHGYSSGDTVTIAGAQQGQYDGIFPITVTGANTFTFIVSGTPVSPATGNITVQRLAGTAVTHSAVVPSGGITLGAAATTDIPLNFGPEDFAITGARLSLNLLFPDDQQLEGTLIAPDGTQVQLFANEPGPVIPVPANQRHDYVNTIFTDDLTATPIQQGKPPFTGLYNPQQPLGILDGKASAGKYILRLKNDSTSLTGTLLNWSLTLQEAVPTTGLGEPVADQATVHFRIFNLDPTNPLSHQVWTAVGPTGITTEGGSLNDHSGRIGAIAVDPSDPSGNTVFIAGASGGIWKTTNFLTADPLGPTYVPLTDLGATYSINVSSIAIVPRNNDPNQSMIFASTGEGDTGSFGVGFIRSLDGGATWTLLDSLINVAPTGAPLAFSARKHDFVGTTSFKLIADPTLSPSGQAILFAAVSDSGSAGKGGIYRSLDSGNTWVRVPTAAGEATDVSFAANSASKTTKNLQVLYAGFAGQGVYISSDQGGSWHLMAGGVGNPNIDTGHDPVTAPKGTPNGGKGRIVLAAPFLTGNAVEDISYEGWLYAAVATAGDAFDGLYMTKDFGQNWVQVQMPFAGVPTNDESLPNFSPGTAQMNYDISLAIDPNNPNVVYLGGTRDFSAYTEIRVDTTKIADSKNVTGFDNNDPDTGKLQGNTDAAGPAGLKLIDPLTGKLIKGTFPALNALRDPHDIFLSNATLLSTGGTFSNTGDDVSWSPFISFLDGSTDQHRIFTYKDPLTGLTRVIIGDDQGVFSAIDQGNGQLLQSIGDTTDLSSTNGDVQFATGSRNGNLQITQFYFGAVQPSILAAQIGQAMFYGNAQDDGFPVSDPNILTDGITRWVGPAGDGAGIAVDQTGTGTAYSYQWPCCGTHSQKADFFGIDLNGQFDPRTFTLNAPYPGKTNGLFPTGQPGSVPNADWPNEGGSNFAVNPIDGSDIIMSSQAGRLFRTNTQGQVWFQVGFVAGDVGATPQDTLDGAYAKAVAYGAPDPGQDPSIPVANDNFFYVGTQAGHVYVTLDGGATFFNVSNGLDGSAVQGFTTNPQRGTHEAYAATSFGVYHINLNVTRDAFGNVTNVTGTWQNVTRNLFQLTHNIFGDTTLAETNAAIGKNLTSIVADWRFQLPNVPGTPSAGAHPILYVGGESGVYRLYSLTDTGPETSSVWSLFPSVATDGSPVDGGYLPFAHVTDLHISAGNIVPTTGRPLAGPADQTVYTNILMATTYGRGIFAITLPQTPTANDPGITAYIPGQTSLGGLPGSKPAKTVSAVEGSKLVNGVVGHFIDDDPNGKVSDYTITVTWDDGSGNLTTTSGTAVPVTVAGKSRPNFEGFDVVATSPFAFGDEGSYPVTIFVQDKAGSAAQAKGSITVADAALSGTGLTKFAAVVNTAVSPVLATFTDANPLSAAGGTLFDYSVSIDWGDGTGVDLGSGFVSYDSTKNVYTVSGSHTYTSVGTGSYNVVVTITDDGGSIARFTTLARVAGTAFDPALTVLKPGTVFSALEGQGVANSLVAHFTDPDTTAQAGDYTVTVTWYDSDGTTVLNTTGGTVTANPSGGFDVTAANPVPYTEEGTAKVTVLVQDFAGASNAPGLTYNVTVADAPLTAVPGLGTVPASKGKPVTLVGVFKDGNVNAKATDFTATVDWGDGSGPQAIPLGAFSLVNGQWKITLTHTYNSIKTGGWPVKITINDKGGAVPLVLTATVNVGVPLFGGF